MEFKFVLTDYIEQAMSQAVYEELDDGSYGGVISCLNVVAFGGSLNECQVELRATLEDWIVVGLRKGFSIPVISGIDLHAEIAGEPVESL